MLTCRAHPGKSPQCFSAGQPDGSPQKRLCPAAGEYLGMSITRTDAVMGDAGHLNAAITPVSGYSSPTREREIELPNVEAEPAERSQP